MFQLINNKAAEAGVLKNINFSVSYIVEQVGLGLWKKPTKHHVIIVEDIKCKTERRAS